MKDLGWLRANVIVTFFLSITLLACANNDLAPSDPEPPEPQAVKWEKLDVETDGWDFWYTAVFGRDVQGKIYVAPVRWLLYSESNGGTWTKTSLQASCISILTIGVKFIYVGTWNSVFRSTDGGISWHWGELPINVVQALAVDSTGILYAGGESAGPTEIYKSLDSGRTWTRTPSGRLYTRALAATRDGLIIAATMGGLFVSSDQANSWRKLDHILTDTGFKTVAINKKGYIFAGTCGVVIRSTDNGINWESVLEFGGPICVTTKSIIVDSLDRIYIAAASSNTEYSSRGVFCSKDDGQTWLNLRFSGHPVAIGLGNNGFILAAGLYGLYRAKVN